MEDENWSNNILDYFMLGYTNQCDTAQCYYTSNYPEILDWNKACINNKDTHDVKEYSKIRGIK